MIRSFGDKDTERLYQGKRVRKFQAFDRAAYRKLVYLDEATSLHDFKGAGFQLEALKEGRVGQHSIRVNDQYRICFMWKNSDAYDVEITDYH